MGWCGYGIYDGDDTQTQHIDYIKKIILSIKEEDIFDLCLRYNKTIIPNKYKKEFIKNKSNILKHKYLKKKNTIFWNEEDCIAWQMALSLFVDNKIKAPKEIYSKGVLATILLRDKYAEDFDDEKKRKSNLNRFLKKAKQNNAQRI